MRTNRSKTQAPVEQATIEVPPIPPVNLAGLPVALQEYAHFVLWRREFDKEEENGDKAWRKVPMHVTGDYRASSTKPATWATYARAAKLYTRRATQNPGAFGLGYVFAREDRRYPHVKLEHVDGFCFIDLDHCCNAETHTIDEDAWEIVQRFNTYTEVSQSGTGVHIIGKGLLPRAMKIGDTEMYDRARFVALTGNRLPGTPAEVNDVQEAADWLYQRLAQEQAASNGHHPAPVPRNIVTEMTLSDRQLIEKIRESAKAERFHTLYDEGAWQGIYKSQSEAVASLLRTLGFWTQCNPERMDRLFRESALMSDKWIDKWDDPRGNATLGELEIARIVDDPTQRIYGDADYRTGKNGAIANAARPAFDWRDHIQTARELQMKVFAPKQFLVDGLIPQGFSIVGGRPKQGKSTLATQIAIAVATPNGFALDRIVSHGRVLYLALEDDYGPRMQDRIKRMLGVDERGRPRPFPEKLDIFYEWPTLDDGAFTHLDDYVAAHPETVWVVIDSLKQLRGKTPFNGGYDADYEFTGLISKWVNRTGKSITAITHTNKRRANDDPDDAPLDLIQNTTGITAGADTVLVMARKNGVMTLFRAGRDLDETDPIKLQGDVNTLLWKPNDEEVEYTARESALLALKLSDCPLKPRAMEDMVGAAHGSFRVPCFRLLMENPAPIGVHNGLYYLTERGVTNKPVEEEGK
jgi:AAA domain/NrS-1  polymerase HBD domain